MSDPFSLAGSAVGVVSLSLTVCQALVTYYQAWHGQDEEVDNFLQQCDAVTKILSLLHDKLESPLRASPEIVNRVETLAARLATAITRLQSVLEECRKTTAQKPLKQKLQDATRRTLYPFRRSTILNLQETVKEMQIGLITTLQLLQVDFCASLPSINQAVSDLREETESIHEKFITTDKNISILQSGVGKITHEFPGLNERLDQVLSHFEELKLDLKGQRVVQSCPPSQDTCIRGFQLALLDKPSAFSLVCDDVGLISARPRNTLSKHFSRRCGCKSRTERRSMFFWTKSVSVSKSTMHSTCHTPECVYWHPFQHSHSTRISASWLSSVLMMTLRATIEISTGAGGCSISPSLSYRRIVPNDSPAFSLLTYETSREVGKDLSQYFLGVSSNLIRLFRNGEAMPQDVNERGGNVLHQAVGFLTYFDDDRENNGAFKILVSDLLDAGVPINETTCEGLTVLDTFVENGIMQYKNLTEGRGQIGAQLVEAGAEVGQNLFSYTSDIFVWETTAFMLKSELQHASRFDTWIEAADFGPLGTAILQKDQEEVARLLVKSASYLKEVTRRGQTPIHLASGWPIGLKMLLAAGGDKLVNTEDYTSHLPIGYACAWECIDSVRILLESGSALSKETRSLSGHEQILEYLARLEGNRALKDVLINALRRQRRGLLDLALATLPREELDALALRTDRLPDYQALKLQRALQQHGVEIPRSLIICQRAGSVFHVISDAKTANLLFNSGFRDLDCLDENGLSPLMYYCFFSHTLHMQEGIEYIIWFLSHGCGLYRTAECDGESIYLPNAVANHWIGIFIGEVFSLGHAFPILDPRSKHLIRSVFTSDSTDSCVCACTSSGCSPSITAWKSSNAYSFRTNRLWKTKWRFLEWLEEIIAGSENRYNKLPNAVKFIRLWTFEGLGLRHTCCAVIPYVIVDGGRDHDEIKEIQSEDRLLINRLEELVPEFSEKYEQLQQPLSTFLKGYWASRMDEILSEETPLTDEELANIRDLGVVLELT